MDERFKDRRIWAVAGVAGIIFLCLTLCAMGALATMFMRAGPGAVTVPPVPVPPAEAGAAPQVYYGPSSGGLFGFLTFGIGMLFKLLFFGLILLLGFGLVRRLLWGPRHWGPHHRWARYRGPHRHGPPGGKEWKGKPHAWGPWAAHWCGEAWEEADEPAGEEGEPDGAEPTYEGAE